MLGTSLARADCCDQGGLNHSPPSPSRPGAQQGKREAFNTNAPLRLPLPG
jgi:hypothetical protein